MTTHPLDGCRAKLRRAEYHLDRLDEAYEEVFGPNPAVALETYDKWEVFPDGNRWRVTYLAKMPDQPEPSSAWALIVGDAVHNMRAALDHLACRLVERHTPGATLDQTAFPIWTDDPTQSKDKLKRYQRIVEGMRLEDTDAIWNLQPFQDPEAETSRKLIDLALLSNMDKHQLCLPMVVVVSAPVPTVTWVEAPLGGEGEMQINEGAPMRPGTPLGRVRAYSGTDQIFFNVGLTQKVVYGGEGSLVGRPELRDIRSHVVGIIESFAPGWV